MTFLFNLLGFFLIFGMVSFILIGVFIIDVIKDKLLKRNKNIYKYIKRK